MKLLNSAMLLLATFSLAACASGSAVRTSSNTMLVQARAAPICGGEGAARVAQQQAAIETIRAGFDRYIILGGASANNVRVTQRPGSSSTYGRFTGNTFTATTYHQPITVVSGNHEQSFSVRMFNDGEPGADQAVSARETLGSDWRELVEDGVYTCG